MMEQFEDNSTVAKQSSPTHLEPNVRLTVVKEADTEAANQVPAAASAVTEMSPENKPESTKPSSFGKNLDKISN